MLPIKKSGYLFSETANLQLKTDNLAVCLGLVFLFLMCHSRTATPHKKTPWRDAPRCSIHSTNSIACLLVRFHPVDGFLHVMVRLVNVFHCPLLQALRKLVVLFP